MSANVCHVSVHADDGVGAVDLALPARVPVAALLPDIVRLTGVDAAVPGRWQLATVCGTVLDESAPLSEQYVRDGDRLLLSTALPRLPGFGRSDTVTAVLASAPPAADNRVLRVTAGLIAAGVGVLAVAAQRMSPLGTAVLVCAVAGVTVAAARSGRGVSVCGPLGCLTVVVAALSAVSAVPGPVGAPHLLFGSAATVAVSAVLLRLGIGWGMVSTATVAFGAVGVIAFSGAAVWEMPRHAVGVVAVVLALGAMSLAPRVSVLAAGLAPPPSLSAEPVDDADRRARAGHRILVGLVVGISAAAAVATTGVAVCCLRGEGHTVSTAVFCAVTGSALLLRARCYSAGPCRWALTLSGLCSLTAFFVTVAATGGRWATMAAVGVGVMVIVADDRGELSPVAARAVDVVEYAVLAAVAPAACAALDVFALVRTSSLI